MFTIPSEVMTTIMLTFLQVPESYLRAVFGSHLASRFVYQHGNNPSHFSFFDLYV